MDFALAILPCFVIWGLNMKRKEKIVVASGLSLGVLYAIHPTFHFPQAIALHTDHVTTVLELLASSAL